MLKAQQTQRIYAMGARLGILESGNKNDNLHTLVYQLTQKESIKSLTEDEYRTVVKNLAERLKLQNMDAPIPHPYKAKKFEDSGRGKMSDGQKRKVWRLMYQIQDLDEKPAQAKLGSRLCGIIKKELHIDAIPKQPFIWLSYQDGIKLIEVLKKYLANAQRRKDGGRGKI